VACIDVRLERLVVNTIQPSNSLQSSDFARNDSSWADSVAMREYSSRLCRHDVNAWQGFTWCLQQEQGVLGRRKPGRPAGVKLLPVQVSNEAQDPRTESATATPSAPTSEGRIEITLADGVRMTISGMVSPEQYVLERIADYAINRVAELTAADACPRLMSSAIAGSLSSLV